MPDGFVARWSDEYKRYFYVDTATGVSQWNHPNEKKAPVRSTAAVRPGQAQAQAQGQGNQGNQGQGQEQQQPQPQQPTKTPPVANSAQALGMAPTARRQQAVQQVAPCPVGQKLQQQQALIQNMTPYQLQQLKQQQINNATYLEGREVTAGFVHTQMRQQQLNNTVHSQQQQIMDPNYGTSRGMNNAGTMGMQQGGRFGNGTNGGVSAVQNEDGLGITSLGNPHVSTAGGFNNQGMGMQGNRFGRNGNNVPVVSGDDGGLGITSMGNPHVSTVGNGFSNQGGFGGRGYQNMNSSNNSNQFGRNNGNSGLDSMGIDASLGITSMGNPNMSMGGGGRNNGSSNVNTSFGSSNMSGFGGGGSMGFSGSSGGMGGMGGGGGGGGGDF
ncbi:hypothetical protein BDR26DRAFT_869824 [Obelidium mucronatum]|nr:hypothetical protein BDR26DRAFT_869824 [Obelidium mucronatum]